jgi:predicted CoA-binding protein
MSAQTVVVLGASPKPERYSNKAVRSLRNHGHHVIPVHPAMERIDGLPVKHRLDDIEESVDTVTLYVGPERGESLTDALLDLHPRRVIFNPGTESEPLQRALLRGGIECVQDCTLLMLEGERF